MELKTRLRSRVMSHLASPGRRSWQHGLARYRRRLALTRPTLHYFHQVDDPCSHLAVQKLDALRAAYALDYVSYLVGEPEDNDKGSAGDYDDWLVRDATAIAEGFGVSFPAAPIKPSPDQVMAVNRALSLHLGTEGFARQATKLGEALWTGTLPAAMVAEVEPDQRRLARRALVRGNQVRARLGHYASGTFYFEGEWYRGVDRLHHLERRLKQEGLALRAGIPLCAPRPVPLDASGCNAEHLTLEYFPSLRSPYSAVAHPRVMDLVNRSCVALTLRPVLPMMMRGVANPIKKARYIMSDCAREAQVNKVAFGRICDPFGEPARRGLSLVPYMISQGKGCEYVGSYLSAAFAEAIDITTEEGLAQVVERAGVAWQDASSHVGDPAAEGFLDDNLHAMEAMGLWGVPSFRLSGGDAPAFTCWGQDRLWCLETEIARRSGRESVMSSAEAN